MTLSPPGALALDPIERAIDDIRNGKMVVVVDDEDRENEGDLIMAASAATPEATAFIIRHTSGILCVAVEKGDAQRLRLPPMVADNDAPLATAFTVSVDYRRGLTTGISAEERAGTIRALANSNVQAEDFVRPGHVFPLIARQGGVLMRTGHTEAAADLAQLAGLRPAGLLAELVNDDGTVMKGPQIEAFAKAHDLALVSIDALIAYRQARETLIERVGAREFDASVGPVQAIEYSTPYDDARHIALIVGDIAAAEAPLVRLQLENALDDVFGRDPTPAAGALQRIAEDGAGVLVYLRSGAAGVARTAGDSAAAVGESETGTETARRERWREVGLGAQIVRDLGLSRIRTLASRERDYLGASAFGVEIVDTVLL